MNDYNKYFKLYNDFLKNHKENVSNFQKEFNLSDDYQNPLNIYTYKFENKVMGIKDRLIGFLIKKIQKENCPNIEINDTEIIKKHNEVFKEIVNSEFIISFIKEKYINHSINLSYEEILKTAKRLCPYSIINKKNADSLNIDEITNILIKKNCLTLQKWINNYGTKYFTYYINNMEEFSSFEKLCRILINKESPVKVKAMKIHQAYWDRKDETLFDTIIINQFGVEKIKLYKNNKFKVWFSKTEYAKMILKALYQNW